VVRIGSWYEKRLTKRYKEECIGEITNLPLNHWFPEHALVSSTRWVVSLSLIQSVSLDGVHPAFYPMFVGLVLAGVVCDAKKLLHSFEESSLKRLTLIFDQRRLINFRDDKDIPPETVVVSTKCLCERGYTKSEKSYRITMLTSSRLIFVNIILPESG
jgi:hypothetical protein